MGFRVPNLTSVVLPCFTRVDWMIPASLSSRADSGLYVCGIVFVIRETNSPPPSREAQGRAEIEDSCRLEAQMGHAWHRAESHEDCTYSVRAFETARSRSRLIESRDR